MRSLGPLFVLAVAALPSLLVLAAPESCVLAERDTDGGDEAATAPPPSDGGFGGMLDGCTCCGKTVLPLSPDCTGHEAFSVPAGDCPRSCKGKTAYVLCEGVCYSECACELPKGFTLVDDDL